MVVRAIVFDIGGVLEKVGPPTWIDLWCERRGLTAEQFDAAMATVGPDYLAVIGGLDEARLPLT